LDHLLYLRQIFAQRIAGVNSEAIWVRNLVAARNANPAGGIFVVGHAVVAAEPDAQHQVTAEGRANLADGVAQKPQPVLERPAVAAGARLGAQELEQEIAMGYLDIYGPEPDGRCLPRRLDVIVFELFQLVIRHHRAIGWDASLRIDIGIMVRNRFSGNAVPP